MALCSELQKANNWPGSEYIKNLSVKSVSSFGLRIHKFFDSHCAINDDLTKVCKIRHSKRGLILFRVGSAFFFISIKETIGGLFQLFVRYFE